MMVMVRDNAYVAHYAAQRAVRRARDEHLGYDGRDVTEYLTGHAETEDSSAVPSGGRPS